jgi:hypothetical protein
MSTLSFTKAVCERYSRWTLLLEEIRRFDLVNVTQPEQICDKCKTTAETILKSVLGFVDTFSAEEVDGFQMPKLITEVLQILSVSESEDRLLRSQLVFLTEVRNSHGTAGHGRALEAQTKIRNEVDHALNERIIRTADSCYSSIIELFEGKFQKIEVPVNYEEYDDFNDYFDEAREDIISGSIIIKPSFALYICDPKAYKLAVAEFKSNTETE